jgi:hypothetical protein
MFSPPLLIVIFRDGALQRGEMGHAWFVVELGETKADPSRRLPHCVGPQACGAQDDTASFY